ADRAEEPETLAADTHRVDHQRARDEVVIGVLAEIRARTLPMHAQRSILGEPLGELRWVERGKSSVLRVQARVRLLRAYEESSLAVREQHDDGVCVDLVQRGV